MHNFLPQRFEQKLKTDPPLYTATLSSPEKFRGHLTTSQTPFFPEYTDHGVQHISEVLKTAAEIIHPNAYKLLKPRDVAAAVIAILIHDIGLHLTPDGFRALLKNGLPSGRNPFSDSPWTKLWAEFE